MPMWRCEVCGYLHEGDEPPDICPKCGAPREKFQLLDEEEAEMMREALDTKEKHAQIQKKLEEIIQIAQEGLDLDLDDGCNQIFAHTKTNAEELYQMIQNELSGHAHQCIWVKVARDGEMS